MIYDVCTFSIFHFITLYTMQMHAMHHTPFEYAAALAGTLAAGATTAFLYKKLSKNEPRHYVDVEPFPMPELREQYVQMYQKRPLAELNDQERAQLAAIMNNLKEAAERDLFTVENYLHDQHYAAVNLKSLNLVARYYKELQITELRDLHDATVFLAGFDETPPASRKDLQDLHQILSTFKRIVRERSATIA